MIKFPASEFIVFYNGDEDEPLKKEMHLSDAFIAETNSLEVIVAAYNINFELSQPLIEKCSYLHDYSFFVDKVKKGKANGLTTDKDIKKAVRYCIENKRDSLAKLKSKIVKSRLSQSLLSFLTFRIQMYYLIKLFGGQLKICYKLLTGYISACV